MRRRPCIQESRSLQLYKLSEALPASAAGGSQSLPDDNFINSRQLGSISEDKYVNVRVFLRPLLFLFKLAGPRREWDVGR
jgi:hypothetical protein